MLAVPLVLIAIFVGVLFYRRTQKAGRELELRRIQSELAALARVRQHNEGGELVPIPVEARRRAAGR
ncbi:hypothetical protein HPO_01707 [Hyphomonas polymorpha PS728]|uniref:Uncharacterized protein n=1 Tax=Hyphomonas polymorpha PS728 TaxID=1280954 RepID=A0A062VKC7_9PROT|nr:MULTISPECIES: hypothetical protein [Hyphomonas]AXE62940.1 hypothetical protein BBF93_01000 [Hyphomonas sp. CACIAM 19H1]KDA00089.1 hypothetical protein HPO_01707 [Hyphomonas polymorpha PS728]